MPIFPPVCTRYTNRGSEWPSYLPGHTVKEQDSSRVLLRPWVPPAAELPSSAWGLPGLLRGLVSMLLFRCTALLSHAHIHGAGARALSGGFSVSWSQGGCPDGASRRRDRAASVSPGPSAWLGLWRRSCSPQESHEPCLPPLAARHHPPQTDSPPGSPHGLLLCPPPPDPGALGAAATAAPSGMPYLEMCRWVSR